MSSNIYGAPTDNMGQPVYQEANPAAQPTSQTLPAAEPTNSNTPGQSAPQGAFGGGTAGWTPQFNEDGTAKGVGNGSGMVAPQQGMYKEKSNKAFDPNHPTYSAHADTWMSLHPEFYQGSIPGGYGANMTPLERAKRVQWAHDNGIIGGIDGGSYDPRRLTAEQAKAIFGDGGQAPGGQSGQGQTGGGFGGMQQMFQQFMQRMQGGGLNQALGGYNQPMQGGLGGYFQQYGGMGGMGGYGMGGYGQSPYGGYQNPYMNPYQSQMYGMGGMYGQQQYPQYQQPSMYQQNQAYGSGNIPRGYQTNQGYEGTRPGSYNFPGSMYQGTIQGDPGGNMYGIAVGEPGGPGGNMYQQGKPVGDPPQYDPSGGRGFVPPSQGANPPQNIWQSSGWEAQPSGGQQIAMTDKYGNRAGHGYQNPNGLGGGGPNPPVFGDPPQYDPPALGLGGGGPNPPSGGGNPSQTDPPEYGGGYR